MISEQWQHIKDILAAVDGMSLGERESALNTLCDGDLDLRREVESLLAQEDRIDALNESADYGRLLGSELQRVGPYQIERLIGAGGMGAVYLATRADDQYCKRVAIKIIQSLTGNRLEQRFRTERQILANLEHSAIARLIDGGTLEDGRPYLVMEYVEGRRIDEYVDEKMLSIEKILHLFVKVCAAVQYAHQNLVVHRDLKAGNILVTESGEPRLLDFGIAKMLTGIAGPDEDETRPYERLLTPSSASPEQVSGGVITTATDVYSLGLLLYRLLTGSSAYAGAKDFYTNPNAAILHYDPPLAGRLPGLSPRRVQQLKGDLEVIVAKALEKEPSRRYSTVEELSAEIQNYLQGRPIKARPASRLYFARKFVRRNRLQLLFTGLFLAAVAAGITGTVIYARRAERERELAVKRLETLRHISESLLFEFHDSIKDLPGSTQARALVVQRAMQYLDELASEDSSDPTVQRDLAAAYVRIGGILAGERSAHTGGPEAADNALRGYEKALAIRRRLVAANPNDPALRKDLLESLWAVSSAWQEEGKLDDALRLQQERLQVIQQAPQKQVDLQYSIASSYAAMSDLERKRGRFTEALDLSRRSLQVRQGLLDADRQSARAQRAVGLSHEFVGYALADIGRYSEAAEEHEKAVALFAALAARTPSSTDLLRNVETSETNLCETLARKGSASEGVPHCRHGLELARLLYNADPRNIQASEDLASAYATLGFTLDKAGDYEGAQTMTQNAVSLFQDSTTQDPDAREAASDYADTLLELAQLEDRLHQGSPCAHLQRADEVLKHLLATEPYDLTIPARLLAAESTKACR